MAHIDVDERGRTVVGRYTGELQTSANLKDRLDEALQPFRAEAPAPELGESYGQYARRAGDLARRVLPPIHELKRVPFSQLPDSALPQFVERLIGSVAEAAWDSRTVDPGSYREIKTVDANSGMKATVFIAPRSFVHDLALPARRVARIACSPSH